ncbi:ATP-binding cassette domain-containing protein [Actinoplanes sp. NPDC049599]|uniref:sugar ABC transporter ATP-binding protein n=1 Tax=Actinoplanes sp. NPDC049599 TaxID=3363903 RepID=UPI0037ABD8AE
MTAPDPARDDRPAAHAAGDRPTGGPAAHAAGDRPADGPAAHAAGDRPADGPAADPAGADRPAAHAAADDRADDRPAGAGSGTTNPAPAPPATTVPRPRDGNAEDATSGTPHREGIGDVVLRLENVVKTFPGVRALDGVQLEVRAGEVHCLLGQNGAGKSTLIKVLAGVHHADEGSISWLGEPFAPASPQAAMRAGIATIYQELDLVDDLSVAENAFLGHEESRGGFLRRRSTAYRTKQILARLGHEHISPRRLVRSLPAAGKQIVSMARALSHDARLIVMDEPSAVLAHDEVENLFRIIRELTSHGIAVIYISHRLEEIRDIGDRVTVLKDGRTTAANLPARSTPTNELVSRMTGRTIEYVFPPREVKTGTTPLLEVDGLSREGEFSGASLSVKAGEIVGIAGLVGSGRSELLETIFGARRADSGTVTLNGKRISSIRGAVRAGMGMAPEERKSQALLLDEPIYRNMTLASFSGYARAGFTDAGKERTAAAETAAALELRPRDVSRPVRTLSGGNQQKVVVGRWLLEGTKLLLLDEPTRGVDVGARAELYQVIHDLAARGVGVLLVSSEVPEVLGLADRVLVMREGHLIHEAAASEIDEATVLDLVMAGSLMEGEPA